MRALVILVGSVVVLAILQASYLIVDAKRSHHRDQHQLTDDSDMVSETGKKHRSDRHHWKNHRKDSVLRDNDRYEQDAEDTKFVAMTQDNDDDDSSLYQTDVFNTGHKQYCRENPEACHHKRSTKSKRKGRKNKRRIRRLDTPPQTNSTGEAEIPQELELTLNEPAVPSDRNNQSTAAGKEGLQSRLVSPNQLEPEEVDGHKQARIQVKAHLREHHNETTLQDSAHHSHRKNALKGKAHNNMKQNVIGDVHVPRNTKGAKRKRSRKGKGKHSFPVAADRVNSHKGWKNKFQKKGGKKGHLACADSSDCREGKCCVEKKGVIICKPGGTKGVNKRCMGNCECREGLQCFVNEYRRSGKHKKWRSKHKTSGRCLNPSHPTPSPGHFMSADATPVAMTTTTDSRTTSEAP